MTGRATLGTIADCARYAETIYPDVIKLMDENGIPMQNRVTVLAMMMQVIGVPDVAEVLQ